MIAWLLAQTIAITGGTAYPVSGPPIPNATVLIRDGRIAAVGANVAIPADATRIDATGKWVTPGLFDSGTQIGLTEISAVDETNEAAYRGDDVAAAFNVAAGINPGSQLIPVTRIEGVTTVLSAPVAGLIRGQAVVIDLAGETVADMLVQSPAAMVADIAEKSAGGGSRAGVVQRLRRVFDDALEYDRRRTDYRRDQIQELAAPAADLEALLPVLRGRLPLVVLANRRSDIESALRLAQDYRLRLVIAGGAEAWMVADRLAAARVPVVLIPLTNIPSYSQLGARYENATLLHRAGITVAIMSGDSHNSRNIKQEAGNAVSYGLPWDAALRAVTLAPAELWGVAERYGSLEPGKVANVVVWSGDPFELSTGVEHVFIRGREIPLVSRQTELFERYKRLPPEY
ncbi:MAG TPA: amidohydrolase family protein [Gemmatimonadales bacterium]|nr:amidohydrolase family protein [Gemmatimonadales bacterium]